MVNPPYFYDGVTTIYAITLGGQVPKAGHVLKDITRDGVAGKAKKWVGFRGEPGVMRPVIDVANFASITTLELGFKYSIGSRFTIRDEAERVWYNVMLEKCDLIGLGVCGPYSGGANGGGILCYFDMVWDTMATFY